MPSSKKNSDIQYKAAPQGMVNLDEAEGIVECFVAGIGNKDSVGDVCAPGAFGKSLIRRKPRVVWGHNWNDPIGKVLDMYEVPPSDPRLPGKMKAAGIGGLYARVQFNLKSEKGREAFANVAFFGEEQEWSIGYKTINAKFDPQMQANILYEVELYEVSPVLHGANQLTGTISIKSEEQPSNVLVNEQTSVDGLSVNELSSMLDALKSIASVTDEKCGPMMPMGMPTGMPSGGPGMPSAPKPMQSPAPRDVVKPEIPSMPENPILVAIRRELVNRTGSNIIVRSAADNVVVFDRITSDGISSTYRLPFHQMNGEFMFGKPEKINMQATPESNAPQMPGAMPQVGGYETTGAFDSGKSLISFDDTAWGEGFGQQIPAQQVDVSALNNVISNLEKIIEEKSTYIIPVDVENAFTVKQAIDPILDYYRVDATVTEDGIIVKSLDDEFLDAMDVATKGVLRSIGNMVDRAVDRPNIGSNRRDRNPNLASRGRGIGSRGAVVRLSDGTMWDPKNAPDRNNNGIVGEGLFDGRGMSLSQPDPTPDGPNSINAPKTPKIPSSEDRQAGSALVDAYEKLTPAQKRRLEERAAERARPIDGNLGGPRPGVGPEKDFRAISEALGAKPKAPKKTTGRISSGEWTRNADGYEMDAPDIEGVYDIGEGLDGKFYVTRYSNYNRNGGQDAQEYEHDKPFSTLAAAKKWVEKDYAQAADEYYGPEGDDGTLSSGAIKKIDEINLPEMPHDEPDDVLMDQYEEYTSSIYDFVNQIEKIARESLGDERYNKLFGGSVPLIEQTAQKGGNNSEQIGWALFHASNLAEKYKKSVMGAIELDGEGDSRLSSGNINFDKIGASGLKEMRHVERNPFRFDTQADKDARAKYEELVANFKKNNGFFIEVPMYSGDPKWHSEDWFRGREMANNVSALRFEEPSTFGTMQLFDKPGKPSKKDFFKNKTSVDYRSWYMYKVPQMTQELDMVLDSDLYSDEYKDAYLQGMRKFLYINRPDMQFAPRETQDNFDAWLVRSGLGWKGRYDTAGPKFEEMSRLSSGANRGSKKNVSARSYENPEDLKEDMFMNLIAGGNRKRVNDMTSEDLAYELNTSAEQIEPYLDEVKNNVISAMDDYEQYLASEPDMTDAQMEQMAQDWARAQTVTDKFAGMTDSEAADYAAWLEEETWRDRDDRFSSGAEDSTPGERAAKFQKDMAARNAILEQMTPEELKDFAEYQQEENYDRRLSSGATPGPKSTVTGEEFVSRGYGVHDWSAYDEEDDFANIDDSIVKALLSGKILTFSELAEQGDTPELSGQALVARPDIMGSNARRIAEAVANNTSVSPSLKNGTGAREDIVHFNYNGRQRSVYPETFSTSKKGIGYFVGWDESADDGKGAYRSFNIDKMEGLASFAISPVETRRAMTVPSWEINDFSQEDNAKILSAMRDTQAFRDLIEAQDVIDGYVAKGIPRTEGSWPDVAEKEAQKAFTAARNEKIDRMVADGDITPLKRADRFSSGKSKARGNRGDGKGRGTPWSAEDRQRFADGDILRSKKREGKRREGPSVREFSSGERLSAGRRMEDGRPDSWYEPEYADEGLYDQASGMSFTEINDFFKGNVTDLLDEWLYEELQPGHDSEGMPTLVDYMAENWSSIIDGYEKGLDDYLARQRKRYGSSDRDYDARSLKSTEDYVKRQKEKALPALRKLEKLSPEERAKLFRALGERDAQIEKLENENRNLPKEEVAALVDAFEYTIPEGVSREDFETLDGAPIYLDHLTDAVVQTLDDEPKTSPFRQVVDDYYRGKDSLLVEKLRDYYEPDYDGEDRFSSGQSRQSGFDFTPEEIDRANKARKYADEFGDWENLPESRRKEYLDRANGNTSMARRAFNDDRDLAETVADAGREDSRLSSGRFAPDGESGSRLQRRLSSGDVKGPPPQASGRYDRKKQVDATMGVFHSDPGTAVVPSDATGILGPVPGGKDSHILNAEVAKKIIANPDMEYSADTGWPVDAGKLLDFIEVNEPDAIMTLREIGDAARIASILGVKETDAQDMLDGKPVYIASSTAADMFDKLLRTRAYPESVGGLNDVARVWGFDGAPKWVRHSDIATPEFDLDENDQVNWSKVKWEGLTRAEFDAEVKRGKNPPEPVYVSPVETFYGDAIASNPKWDARGGSFKNPTVDSEFIATPKKVTRAEQLEPERYKSQARVGQNLAKSDKDFTSKWAKSAHGVTSAQMMEMLGVERDSEGPTVSKTDASRLIAALNEIREKAGLPLVAVGADGKFRRATVDDFVKKPISDELMHALITSGRFKSMKEAVASLGDPRLDSLAADYDSRILADAALIRIKNRLDKDGVAGAQKILFDAITTSFGRKQEWEKRIKEGRVSIKGQMTEDGMIGDEKIAELLDTVNEKITNAGYSPITADELFPKDETGGFVDNLSSAAPGAPRMSSGQRFVARTSSSRRTDAMEEAAVRRQGDRPRLSSGSIQSMPPFRDEDGKLNPANMASAAESVTVPEGLSIRKTPGQNLEDFEKAVKLRAAIAETLNIDTEAISGFTVYDVIDELTKAGIPEDVAEDLIGKLVDLDFYIDGMEEKFSNAREAIDTAIEEAEDALDKISKLRKERADIIKRYGEEDGQPLLEVVDEKISRVTKKLDDAYQRGIGNEDARMGTLHAQVDEILSNNRGWRKHDPYPYVDRTNQNLAALEVAIAKAGGTKKAVPVTGIDFGVPEGTRLSSGKSDEYFQNLTSHLINMIEKSQKDGGKWEAPWHKAGSLPRNASTKNMYSGGNLFALMLAAEEKGYTTPHWGGFQQWKKLGGSVKKGEKATIILMPKQMFGEEIDPDTGKKIRKSKGVYFTTAHVFNLDQVEGIDRDEFLKMPTDALTPEQKVSKLEDAIKEVGADIRTGDGSRAYYSPREDHVVMPPFELFKTPEGYYGTLAHELVHWTGHSSRLDRKNMNQFGSPDYAREELVAEFGSAFLLAMFGLSAEPREDHAHYLANWLQVLRDEPNALQEASIKAQAASKMLIDKMKAVLEEMGEVADDAESTADVKSLQIFNDPFYGVKDAYIEWSKDPFNAPFLVKSLDDRNQSSGLVNRSWERIAETAIFLERLSRKK